MSALQIKNFRLYYTALHLTNFVNICITFSCVHKVRRDVTTVKFHSLNQLKLVFQCLAILRNMTHTLKNHYWLNTQLENY